MGAGSGRAGARRTSGGCHNEPTTFGRAPLGRACYFCTFCSADHGNELARAALLLDLLTSLHTHTTYQRQAQFARAGGLIIASSALAWRRAQLGAHQLAGGENPLAPIKTDKRKRLARTGRALCEPLKCNIKRSCSRVAQKCRARSSPISLAAVGQNILGPLLAWLPLWCFNFIANMIRSE